MNNIYSEHGLQTVINASGRMTKLGVSTISKGVGKAMLDAASNYVVIDDLLAYAGKNIGEMTGNADACVTSSASAGIALSVASLICGNNLRKVQNLYDLLPEISRREVIILKGHNVDYGAPIAEMIQLGGGKVIEVGFANGAKLDDIRSAVTEHTLAILFVKSHHCVQKEMPAADAVIQLANTLNIPCIVDAAAEEDLNIYAKTGADFVCYSGTKAIEGPTSGFTSCKTKELADNMRLQYKGIGRAMKVGKEGIMGLLKALEEYLAGSHKAIVTTKNMADFTDKINEISGCKATMIQDEAGRDIYRCRIDFDAETYGLTAKEVVKKLQEGSTAVFTRDYNANIGSIAIDPRPLTSHSELDFILERIQEFHKESII